MKVSNHQTKENNDAMKVSNHQTKKNDAMKENIRRTTDGKRMMRRNVDRRLVLMFRRPTDDRTFAQVGCQIAGQIRPTTTRRPA